MKMFSSATVATPIVGVATACFLAGSLSLSPLQADDSGLKKVDAACRIQATFVLPDVILTPDAPEEPNDLPVRLGGISDLACGSRLQHAESLVLWCITDRGPTEKQNTPSGKRRVFLNPQYGPSLLTIVLPSLSSSQDATSPPKDSADVKATRRLFGQTGAAVSGRANGIAGDEQIVGPSGEPLAPDPNGIDSEGLVVCADGSFWISEEYRPSLMRCDADGTIVTRYVPEGIKFPAADMQVIDNLPARYAKRRDNRGFEAITISPDEATLWVSLQSPLEWPSKNAAKTTGNIRLLAFDADACKPIGEYVYRLGDPTDPAYAATGVSPDDGKICAMGMDGDDALLVLEQSDAGEAKLYRCQWRQATNTLTDPRPLEEFGDLQSHGVRMLEKTLVVDLGPLLPKMAADITKGQWSPKQDEPVVGLKLEGMAVLDRQRIAFCNDNDFDMDHFTDTAQPTRLSCIWIVSLDVPLAGISAAN